MARPRLLAVGGSDPLGGAGLQRAEEVAGALGVDASLAVALETEQPPEAGLVAAEPTPPEALRGVLDRLAGNGFDAVLVGALGDAPQVAVVADFLAERPETVPVVLDPVFRATRSAAGAPPLLTEAGVYCLRDALLPLVDVVTPNLEEYGDGAFFAGVPWVLLKGGHADGDEVVDRLLHDGAPAAEFRAPRLPGATEVHGTGCTLAAALAARLAHGDPVPAAAARAHAFVQARLRRAR